MMMKWIPVALALALTACSSAPETRNYQLPVTGSNVVLSGELLTPVWVESITVADYLSSNGVVYQSNDVQYVIAASNRWASPLEQQLQQTLINSLSAELPGTLVSATAPAQPHDTLNMTITGFHGRYDGKAVISGEWVLQHEGQLRKRSFMLTLPQKEDGYDSLIRTLAQGWQQVSTQIANAIIQLR